MVVGYHHFRKPPVSQQTLTFVFKTVIAFYRFYEREEMLPKFLQGPGVLHKFTISKRIWGEILHLGPVTSNVYCYQPTVSVPNWMLSCLRESGLGVWYDL